MNSESTSAGAAFFDLDRTLLRGASGEVFSEAMKNAGLVSRSIPGEKYIYQLFNTIGETLRWLEKTGFRFVKTIPVSKPFQPLSEDEPLFESETPGNAFERLMVELGMISKGSREGGFFIVIGRRPPTAA